jgi:putative DNA primase/helicase
MTHLPRCGNGLRRLDGVSPHRGNWLLHHSKAIANARPEIPSSLNDRAADIWEPLLAIADLAGGEWLELARQAALKLGSYDDDITLIGYFLKDIRTLMLNGNVDRILSRDIIRVLNPRHDRPWEDLRRGREINEWWLGRRLSELGIRWVPSGKS